MAKITESNVSRRAFIAGAAATGVAAAALTGCSNGGNNAPAADANDPYAGAEIFYATCPPECQHHNLKGYVIDGQLVKVESSELNDCAACARGIARCYMHTDPNRLMYPMKSTGEKGPNNTFEQISWDEALDLIAEKINWAIEDGGNKSIYYVTGSGNFGNLTGVLPGAFFAGLGGAGTTVGALCCAGTTSATIPMFGKRFMDCRNQIVNSDYVLVWGNNPAISKQGYFGRFMEMQEKGGKLVTIDPVVSETASKSDMHVQVWPGTDAALELAMLKIIIDENLMDIDFMTEHSTVWTLIDKATEAPLMLDEEDDTSFAIYDTKSGEIVRHDTEGAEPAHTTEGLDIAGQYATVFEYIKAEADKWPVDAAAEECRISADEITTLAHDYAAAEHAMIIQNMGGFMRTENGSYATGLGNYLAVFTGNVGHVGDGVSDAGGIQYLAGGKPFPNTPEVEAVTAIPRFTFGQHVMDEDINKVNFFWSMTGNPLTQWPNSNSHREALKKIPFVVSVDQYMTDTCMYSDLVLPCTGIFETENVLANARSHWVQIYEKAVPGPGESKSDLEIFQALAQKMGFGEDYFMDDVDTLISRVIEPLNITLDELKEKKAIDVIGADYIAYEGGQFYTSTGKAHLWMPSWQKEGFKGVCSYDRAQEDSRNEGAAYPLMAVQRKTYRGVHSTFVNLPLMDEICETEPIIMLNAADAEARGIANGDHVVVYNDRGEHRGVAEVGQRIIPGLVCVQNGWWGHNTSSMITNDRWKTLGGTHCCNNTIVDIKKEA